jgi:hypothetical protein
MSQLEASYDRVELRDGSATGLPKRFTRAEFESLPLDQRVRAILSKKLRFFRGDQEIPMREAFDTR